VGIVALAGAEVVAPLEGGLSLRPRLGLGVRVALTARTPLGEGFDTTPSLAFLGGCAGLTEARLFGEVRLELAVSRPGGFFQPAFTVYALGGTDVLVAGAADPYFGAGLGWDVNVFKGDPNQPAPKSVGGGWGGGSWGGGGGWGGAGVLLLPVIIAAAVAIVGFICVGRIEVRYHPLSSRMVPASMTVLVGFGF
jgi:hypothetical protein